MADFTHGCLARLSPLSQLASLRLNEHETFGIVGRIRLDRRDDLKSQLETDFGSIDAHASDADLCLRAYVMWGNSALDRLHGDFAFAVWDQQRRKLLCARDRLGVRALAYLERDGSWWISDSLADLVDASRFDGTDLDRIWISDFLKVGFCDDPARTVYSGVRRLPPAHTLTIAPECIKSHRYWQLEVHEPLFLKSSSEYIERFHELLNDSIRDRMPEGRVGIMMSGGLDSSTLAAKAVEVCQNPDKVFARTWLVCPARDPEAKMSRLVGQALGIRQEMIDSDLLHYDPDWQRRPGEDAEPDMRVIRPEAFAAETQAMADVATVWFYGEGPDNSLTFEWRAYLAWLLRRGKLMPFAKAIAAYGEAKSLEEWKTTLRVWTGRHAAISTGGLSTDWIRYSHCGGDTSSEEPASWRPRALESFRGSIWPKFFEKKDTDYSSAGIDWRHPFLDLRLLEFMLCSPPIPWGHRKDLIRRSMKGRLPLEILRRDKAPLHHDLAGELLRRNPPVMPTKGKMIDDYVDLDRLPSDQTSFADPYALLRVSILDHWLNSRYA